MLRDIVVEEQMLYWTKCFVLVRRWTESCIWLQISQFHQTATTRAIMRISMKACQERVLTSTDFILMLKSSSWQQSRRTFSARCLRCSRVTLEPVLEAESAAKKRLATDSIDVVWTSDAFVCCYHWLRVETFCTHHCSSLGFHAESSLLWRVTCQPRILKLTEFELCYHRKGLLRRQLVSAADKVTFFKRARCVHTLR